MANPRVERLIYTAVNLSMAAPKEWDEFLKSLEEYSVDLNRRLLSAEPANLSNAQGQAVQAAYILQTLTDARRTTQKAEVKRNLQKPNERAKWPLP